MLTVLAATPTRLCARCRPLVLHVEIQQGVGRFAGGELNPCLDRRGHTLTSSFDSASSHYSRPSRSSGIESTPRVLHQSRRSRIPLSSSLHHQQGGRFVTRRQISRNRQYRGLSGSKRPGLRTATSTHRSQPRCSPLPSFLNYLLRDRTLHRNALPAD